WQRTTQKNRNCRSKPARRGADLFGKAARQRRFVRLLEKRGTIAYHTISSIHGRGKRRSHLTCSFPQVAVDDRTSASSGIAARQPAQPPTSFSADLHRMARRPGAVLLFSLPC